VGIGERYSIEGEAVQSVFLSSWYCNHYCLTFILSTGVGGCNIYKGKGQKVP
jgi:hypothetical protein